MCVSIQHCSMMGKCTYLLGTAFWDIVQDPLPRQLILQFSGNECGRLYGHFWPRFKSIFGM